MKRDPRNFEHLTRLTLRAGRLLRLAKADSPAILIRNEALLILAAALDLDQRSGAKRDLASWIAAHPEYAFDGGALVDLRNDTLDEAIQAISAFTDDGDRQLNAVLEDICENVAELKTTPACAELEYQHAADWAPDLRALSDPIVSFAVIVPQEHDPETDAFLAAARVKGFEVQIDDHRQTVHIRAPEARGVELETLRSEYLDRHDHEFEVFSANSKYKIV